MKLLGQMLEAIIRTLIMILTGAIVLVFMLCAISNYEDSKEDWRNYELQFNIEDGISANYKVPADELVEDTVDDFLEVITELLNG